MTNSLFAEIEQDEARAAAQIAQAESLRNGEPFAMSDWAGKNGWVSHRDFDLYPLAFTKLAEHYPGLSSSPCETADELHRRCALAAACDTMLHDRRIERNDPPDEALRRLYGSALATLALVNEERKANPKVGEFVYDLPVPFGGVLWSLDYEPRPFPYRDGRHNFKFTATGQAAVYKTLFGLEERAGHPLLPIAEYALRTRLYGGEEDVEP